MKNIFLSTILLPLLAIIMSYTTNVSYDELDQQYEYIIANHYTQQMTFDIRGTEYNKVRIEPGEERVFSLPLSQITLYIHGYDQKTNPKGPGVYVLAAMRADRDHLYDSLVIVDNPEHSTTKKTHRARLTNYDYEPVRVTISGKEYEIRENQTLNLELYSRIKPLFYLNNDTNCCQEVVVLKDHQRWYFDIDRRDRYERFKWLVD